MAALVIALLLVFAGPLLLLRPDVAPCGSSRAASFAPLLTGSDIFAFERHLRIRDLLIPYPAFG